MKSLYKIFAVMLLCFWADMASAQTPQGINYQAVVRNGSGNIAANAAVTFRFSFRENTASGTQRYQETHSVTTDAFGMADVVLGAGTATAGTFAAVDWSKSNYLRTEVNLSGSYVNVGTKKFQAVPYALNAGGGPWTVSGNDVYRNNGDVGIGTSTPTQKLDVDGRMQLSGGVIQTGGTPITNTSDLGLYSRVQNNWMRFVTKDGDFRFFTLDDNGGKGTDADARFTIGANGQIRVGNSSGGSLLSVKSTGNVYGFRLERASNSTKIVDIYEFDNDGYITVNDGNGNTQSRLSGYDQVNTYFNSNTGVGFGGYNNAALAVSSSQDYGLYVLAPNATNWGLYVNGTAAKPGGSSWSVASDNRLKDRVSPYSDGLSTLLKINPVKFHYIEESGYASEPEYVGVIAQELNEVAPYMTGTFTNQKDKQEYMNVDNTAMTYMLINAVKEQQAQIEALQAQVRELQQK